MSLAKCLKKLKIDSSHEDSIISGLASLTEQGNLEGYRKASLALDQAMNDTLDEQEDLHIQLEKQGYSFKEDSSVKDSKLLEEKLNNQGYTFTITPKNVRDFVAKDKTRETQATTATNLASKFGKRITWIDAKGDFGINGVVVPNIKDVIFLDVNTKYPAHAVMGHELSHHLEYDKPEVYKNLVTSMEGLLKNHKEYAEKYKIEGASHKDIVKEMIGDIVGDNFTKQDFWNKLADQDRSLFTKIADAIKAWLEQFIKSDNLGSDAFVKDVKKAREVIALAIAQYKDVQQPTQSAEAKFHKVWHGSPHDHNKFDTSKIGTGEGAQAYGYGHYFADSKEVAEFYKKTLSNDDNYATTDGGIWSPNSLKNLNARVKVRDALRKSTDLTNPIAQVRDMMDRNESQKMRDMIKLDLQNLTDIQNKGGLKNTLGKLYEVELAPEQDEYLLWDKPLSEQSEKVRAAVNVIETSAPIMPSGWTKFNNGSFDSYQSKSKQYSISNIGDGFRLSFSNPNGLSESLGKYSSLSKAKLAAEKHAVNFQSVTFGDISGSDIYRKVASQKGSDKQASDYLHSIGIRGIKYLDGSSRGKGEGNYNYVIFDDNDIKIEAKFSKVAAENTLIAQHNLSVKNLLHADRMGGLAAPSIAVTDKAHPLKGFGEITLLSDKDLVDPKQGAKTYGSDIYSPRYPQLSYDFSGKAIKKLNEILSDGIEKTGDREFYNDSLENDPFRELTYSSAAMYQFLKEQGADPKLAFTKPKELPNESFRPFADSNMDSFDLSKDEKFKEVVKEHYAQISEKEKIDDDAVSNLARAYARDVIAYRDAKKNIGKIDRQATNSSLFRQITDSDLRNKFDDFLVDIVNRAAPKERIFQGYTNSGNRRYIPHDIDNVIKLLKKDLRGGENFKYGLGSIRAKYSPQFKSIDQIRKSKNRLMDSETFDLVKKEIQTELDSLNESLASYGTFSGFDNVETMLSDAAKMGISRALKENGFENVPDSIKIDIQNFINKLKDMPTEYFEAKLLRAVKLGEFTAAIIPDDSTQQVKDILKKNGIEDIREYKAGDNEDRVKQINQVDRVMFSRVAKEMPKTIDIDNIDQLMNVLDKHKEVFVRWSAGPKYDMKKGAVSRDFSNGDVHKGLSAVPIKSGMSKSDVAKYVSEYSYARGGNEFTRSKGVEISAYIYTGEIVGSDSDGYPSIAPNKFIGKLSDKFINDLDEGMDAELKLREDIDEIENRLSNWTGDNIGLDIAKSQLMKKEKELESILNNRSKGNVLPATININGVDRPTTNSEGKLIPNPEKFYAWFGDSKVVDDQGEPLVVYHGTSKDITVFNPDEGKGKTYGTGSFFSSNPDTSATYTGGVNGGNIMPVYLHMEKPAVLDAQGSNWNRLNKNTRITLPEVTVSAQADEDLLAELEDRTPGQGATRKLKARNTTLGRLLPDAFRYVDDYGSTDDIARWARQKGYDGLIIHNVVDQGSTGNFANEKSGEPSTIYVAYDANQVKSATGNNGDYSSTNNDIRFSKEAIPEETTYQKSQRTVQDKFNRFSVIRDWLKERGVKLTELSNVYDAEERYHAKVANQLEDFREKVRNPLIERIAKAGFTLSDVQDFLLAQHAAEANKQIQKVRNDSEALAYGITDEEANEYLSKVKPELVTLANELRDVTEQAKQLRLDAGILNKDITDNWDNTYKHYIPVKGDESIQGTGKGLNVKHKDKRRLGHEKRNEAVIENILMDYERAVMEVEKNRVGKYLVMFAAEANNPDLITVGQPEKRNILKENNSYAIVDSDGVIHSVYVNKIDAQRNAPKGSSIQKISDPRVISQASPVLAPNEVNVYMDGHAIRVQLNDDLLARAYANMGVESVGAIVEAGRVLNSYLSKVYTGYNPEFIVTNIIRDFTSGIVNLTGEEGTLMAIKAIGNYPKMFTDLFRYAVTRKSTELIDSYRANGGNTGAAYLSDMERLGKEISSEYASYQGVIANIKAGDGANAFRAAGRKVFNSTLKWIEHLNQAGENAMRLSAYKAMLDSGKTVEQASKVAKNITVNFNRRGEIGQTANALYLFFNASVQGSAAVLHANLKGNHKYQANALAVGMASLGYMLAAGLGGMDEEEYDKIDDTTKERNLIIGSEGSYVKIPIPYGYGFFFNTGRVIADAQRKGEFGKAPFRMAVNAVEELTPFGNLVNSDEINSEQVVGGVAPTALQIPYQMSTNTSLFTGKEIRPVSPFDNSQPEREQMFRNTKGTVYDDMAGLLSNAGFDVSPENIKFLTRTLTGGAGALVDTAVSSSKLKAQGAELDIKEMPFIRKFMGENTISNDRSAYYKAVEEAKKAAEEFSRARKNNDISSMKKIMEDKRELLAMDKYADKLRKVIKLSRDMQDSVRLNEEIPIAEKRLKLKELEAQEAKLYEKYLDVYKSRVK